MQYHVPNKKKDDNKTWIERSEKWSDYYTCKQREVEVNRKGHLTKLQEGGHLEMLNIFLLKLNQNIILPILKHV